MERMHMRGTRALTGNVLSSHAQEEKKNALTEWREVHATPRGVHRITQMKEERRERRERRERERGERERESAASFLPSS